jgi:putative ABC transport system permease protein
MTPRLSIGDIVAAALHGMRTRRLRVALSTAGIAIGITAMIAVVGISESSRAQVLARIDALGTNLLTFSPARGHEGDPAAVPPEAAAMIRRIGPVQHASAVGGAVVDGQPAAVYRNDRIPPADTGGLVVLAAQPDLLATVGGAMQQGRFLDAAQDRYPTVVLGHDAAVVLGIDLRFEPSTVWLAGRLFVVVGILQPVGLTPELDRAALIGFPEAAALAGPGQVTPIATVYLRADPAATTSVQSVLARTANPADPVAVEVGRPSDALAARAAADSALTALLLGLGAVALVVGGLGIANVMVIAVLERRAEIGLRRALGATRRHIAWQFLIESLLIALTGGVLGAGAGLAVTIAWATHRAWPIAIPAGVLAGGAGAVAVIGAVAGLYPALQAARLSPTEALTTP